VPLVSRPLSAAFYCAARFFVLARELTTKARRHEGRGGRTPLS
jgi:hypothetical protein